MNDIEGRNQIESDEQIESLRLILEREQERPFSHDEARELGESLITFFEILAEEPETPAIATA
jgi:hypothetical protein